ncbi:MAG: amidohydrolase family protein [Streptosporangiaceae bacterium]
MARVIDFHVHYTPERLVAPYLGNDGSPTVLIKDGVPATTHHDRLFRIDRHVECMDAAGITCGVLSSGAGLGSDQAACAIVNSGLAEVADMYPGRFLPLVHLDPRESGWSDQLKKCIGEYGFVGVAFPTSFGEMRLDDPALLPVYEAVAGAGLFIFIHPALPVPPGLNTYYDAYDLYRCVGREHELVVATVRLVAGGVFDKVPELRVVMSHLAGGMAAILERVRGYQDKAHLGLPPGSPHARTAARPVDYYLAHNMYFDTAGVFGSVTAVRAALMEIPADRIVFGSDYPQEIRDAAHLSSFVRALQDSGLAASTVHKILSQNGEALLAR